MSCPKCGCKVCYEYEDGDYATPSTPDMERCAACWHIFPIEDHIDEDEDLETSNV